MLSEHEDTRYRRGTDSGPVVVDVLRRVKLLVNTHFLTRRILRTLTTISKYQQRISPTQMESPLKSSQ